MTPILDQLKVKKMIFGELKTFQLSSNLTRWTKFLMNVCSIMTNKKWYPFLVLFFVSFFLAITSLPVTEITNLTVLSNIVCGFYGLKN